MLYLKERKFEMKSQESLKYVMIILLKSLNKVLT